MRGFGEEPAVKNPVDKYYEWKSKNKAFIWYDKDTKKDVELKTDAHVIVLYETVSITGYSEKYESGFTSNEMSPYDLKKEKFNLKTFGKNQAGDYLYSRSEFWGNLKDILPNGAKFTKNLYSMLLDKDNGNNCCCLKFPGGSIAPLADIENKGFDNQKHILLIKDDFTAKKRGEVDYTVPVLDYVDINEGYVEDAKAMYQEVNKYFLEKTNLTGNSSEHTE